MSFRKLWSATEVAKLVAGLRAAQIRDFGQLKSEFVVLTAMVMVMMMAVMMMVMAMDILMIYNRLSCGGFMSVKIKKDDLLFHLAAVGEGGSNWQRCRCRRPRESYAG
jgi:hypothetical protein